MKEITDHVRHQLLKGQAFYFQHLLLGFDEGLAQVVLNVFPDAQLRAGYPCDESDGLSPVSPEEGSVLNEALIKYSKEGVLSALIPTFTPYTDDWADYIPTQVAVRYQLAQVNQVIDMFSTMTKYDKEYILNMIETLAIRPDFFDLLDIEELDDTIDDTVLPLDLNEAVTFLTELELLDAEAGTLLLYIITAYEE